MRQGRRITAWRCLVSAAVACGSPLVLAQSAAPVEPSAVPGDAQPTPAAGEAVPDDGTSTVPRFEMPEVEAARPSVEALPRPWVQGRETRVGMPASSVDLDPSVIGPMPGSPAPQLYREGDFVVDRLGRLRVLPNGATAFVFVDETGGEQAELEDEAILEPGARAMVLQPCQRLETMLSAAEQQEDRDALFRLTGQVHVYRGVNYLMPTELTGYQVQAETAPAAEAPPAEAPIDLPDAAADPDAPAPAPEQVGVQPTVEPRDPAEMMNAMAEELDALTQDDSASSSSGNYGGISAPLNPRRPQASPGSGVGVGGTRGAAGPSAGGGGDLVREGEFVVSRAGRVVRSSDTREVLFAFEADGPGLAEAPMGILPCRLRVWMEDAVSKRGDSAVFVVSGRVTQFRGANYLLPSVVKLRVESDALGG